jgi:hypothetical protein
MYFFTLNNNNMKTTTLIRMGILPMLALAFFACKKEAQNSSGSTLLSSQAAKKVTPQGPTMDWSVSIQVTKNACNEQVFTLTGLNGNGNAIGMNDGQIELTISDANGVAGSPYTGTSPLTVTTHLAPGTYSLSATVSTGGNLRGQSSLPSVTVAACASCTYKGLDELTCADLPADMYIGEVQYNHEQLCQLLAYNRGNQGYGSLVRLAQAVLVAKVNGFTSTNEVVAAAEVLIGHLNALDAGDQASVDDQYGATQKGHVQDLVKCNQ